MGYGVQLSEATQEVMYRQYGQVAKPPLAFSTLGPGGSAWASALVRAGKSQRRSVGHPECKGNELQILSSFAMDFPHKDFFQIFLASIILPPIDKVLRIC